MLPSAASDRASSVQPEQPEQPVTASSDPVNHPPGWRDALRLADLVHGRLVESGRTVAVAESLTGGLISAFLTTSPGTNVTFRGGLVVYATDLKCTAAGVRPEDLERHGPVHPLIAEQLASGARERLSADYGVGVTGVAGPGAQGGRPVGEVLVAVGSAAGTSVRRHEFDGDRDAVRIAAAAAALGDLVDVLDSAAVETHRDRSRGSD